VPGINVDTIQKQHVEMGVEIQRTRLTAHQDRFLPAANRNLGFACAAEALDQRHCTGLCRSWSITRFVGEVRSDSAVDDAQCLTHDSRLTGKQKAQRERYAEDPLPHRLMRQDFIYQQSGAVSHTPCTATGTEAAAFAAERHQFLMVAGLTANPQEAMLQPAALQVLIKFATNESGQVFALAGQFSLKFGPVLTYDLVEQGSLGAVAYVSCG
jgi:hypothetical protein